MFLGKTYQEFSSALTSDAIVVVKGRWAHAGRRRESARGQHVHPEFGASLGSATCSRSRCWSSGR